MQQVDDAALDAQFLLRDTLAVLIIKADCLQERQVDILSPADAVPLNLQPLFKPDSRFS